MDSSLVLVSTDNRRVIPLTDLSIKIKISHFLAETSVLMTFTNDRDEVLEGELLFPLPEGGAVCGYALDIDGIMVDGVVVSKTESRTAFETTGGTNSCGIVEQTVGNVYKTRVYPVPGRGSRSIKLVFCEEIHLKWEKKNEKHLVYHFPSKFSQVNLQRFLIEIEILFPNVTILLDDKSQLSSFINFRTTDERKKHWMMEMQNYTLQGELISIEMVTSTPLVMIEKDVQSNGYYYTIVDKIQNQQKGLSENNQQIIRILWDSSFSQRNNNEKPIYLLIVDAFFQHFSNALFDITQFRNEMGQSKMFDASERKDALQYLQDIVYDGGTCFSDLKIQRTTDNGIHSFYLLFTNGVGTLTKDEIHILECPVHVFSREEEANHHFLRKLAQRSGGTYHNLTTSSIPSTIISKISASTERTQICYQHYEVSGIQEKYENQFRSKFIPKASNIPLEDDNLIRVVGWTPKIGPDITVQLFYGNNSGIVENNSFTLNSIPEESYFLQRYWAQKRIRELLDEEVKTEVQEDELESLSKTFKLVTPYTSMLVLSTLDQYLTYQVLPPPQLPEMRVLYNTAISLRKQQLKFQKENKIFNILSLWRRRLDWWKGYKRKEDIQMEWHFKDYSKELTEQANEWNTPSPQYLFDQFATLFQQYQAESVCREQSIELETSTYTPDTYTPEKLDYHEEKSFMVDEKEILKTYENNELVEDNFEEDNSEDELVEDEEEDIFDSNFVKPPPKVIQETTTYSSLKKGDKIMLDGKQLKIVDTMSSKTGKHGAAKNFLVAIDSEGKKVEQIRSSSATVQKVVPGKPQIASRTTKHKKKQYSVPAAKNKQSKMPLETKSKIIIPDETMSKIIKPLETKSKIITLDKTKSKIPITPDMAIIPPTEKRGSKITNTPDMDTIPVKEKKDSKITMDTTPMSTNALRKGDAILVDGRIIKILDLSSSKTGKHGSQKVHLVGINEDGKKIDLMQSSTTNVEKVNMPQYQKQDPLDFSTKSSIDVQIFESLPTDMITTSIQSDDFTLGTNVSIKLNRWNSQCQWMKSFHEAYVPRQSEPVDYYKAYLEVRPQYQFIFGFYFDVACFMFDKSPALGYRILSTITELELENPHLMRVVARKLEEQEKFVPTAIQIYERILEMRPEEPQSYRDLALALIQHPKLDVDMHCKYAASLLNKIIKGIWPKMKFERYNQIEVITLMELNKIISIIQEHNAGSMETVDYSFIDQRLLFLPRVDLRIVLQWNDNVDIELHVTDPNGETCFCFHNTSKIGGYLSTDCPRYGPEEFVVRRAIPGSYIVNAKRFHSTSNNPSGTIVTATIFVRFGQKEEAHVHSSVRLSVNKEVYHIATIFVHGSISEDFF